MRRKRCCRPARAHAIKGHKLYTRRAQRTGDKASYREGKDKNTDDLCSEVHTRLRLQEDCALLAAEGFEAAEDGLLWRKDGLWYGREAALQQTRRASWG